MSITAITIMSVSLILSWGGALFCLVHAFKGKNK